MMKWAVLVSMALLTPAMAQSHRRPPMDSATGPTTAPAGKPDAPADDGKPSITQHQIMLNGKPLDYTATAGPLAMKDENGKTKANIFSITYETASPEKSAKPLTFLFNGGPGAAAVWLHLGGIGPRVLELDDKAVPVGPPFKLIDNQATWLGFSDLVFVDPVGTGYSRAVAGEDAHQFYGFQNDITSVAEFVRTYLNKHHRWGSPIYLAGESYGTTRCAALAGYLADRYGIEVNGVTLISSVLDFSTLSTTPANDLPYEMYLPSYAAVAWYHKKLSPDLQADFDKTINAARAFTADEYVPALQKGAAITPEQRAHLIKQISAFTGLTADLIERSNLRINPGEFEKQLLGDGRQIIGRFDGRITGFDPANHGGPEFDPSLSYYLPAYASAFNQYVRDDLKYENDLPYEVLSNSVHPWSMKDEEGNPLYVTDDLQDALLQHPRLRVQFVSGYYDLATPFYSADYTINRMNLDPAARANVTHLYYPSGHMIYHNRAAAKEFAGAMEKFVTGGK
jgi:carboxypeptidase C (cathepsin A)